MDKIQSILDNNKGDITLYRIIFNVLSEHNKLNNYTNNSNGILFNMNSFDSQKIQYLCNNINSYIENKKEFENIENNRENIMKELSKTIDTTYKTELKNMINSNKKSKNTLSTQIETDSILTEKNQEKDLKKNKNKRIEKSVKKYIEPIIYKGTYDRINNILSKNMRRSRNTSIEEEDILYEVNESDNCESEDSYIHSDDECIEKESIAESEVEKILDDEIKDDIKDLFGSDSE